MEKWRGTFWYAGPTGRERKITVTQCFPENTPIIDIVDTMEEKAHENAGIPEGWDLVDSEEEQIN